MYAVANGLMDTCVGVAVCVHLVVCIALQVGLGPVKCSGQKDPMVYACDVSCVIASRSSYRKMNPHNGFTWHLVFKKLAYCLY